ncbi:MAG: hypothetical protein K2P94_00585 [Rhodospirillaceae bacterium]|nr:hypothetical protein [Rhodospirillaceae bacterium]
MVDQFTETSSPAEVLNQFYQLGATLRSSGIPEDDLQQLEKIWLQRKDIPANLYHYAAAAFIAGFTGQPKPQLQAAAE